MEAITTDLLFVTPLLTLTLGAILALMYEVFIQRYWPKGGFTAVVLATAFGINLYLLQYDYYFISGTAFSGQLFIDKFTGFINCFILLIATLSVLLSMSYIDKEKIEAQGEYYALILMSTIGAIIFNSAAEFITLFIGLEIMSMALYCLCGSAVTLRSSAESALKYFLLGSFSSAFLLYGIALVYGLTGSFEFMTIANKTATMQSSLLSVAIGLVLVGLLFKIAAAPFHFWAPDVYQGAPTSVTIYMASVIKASAMIVVLRVLWMAFPDSLQFWSGAVWTLAVITMTVGNLIALRQRSLKRMLAYSSIAHAGYMMVALLVAPTDFGGGAAIIYYLIAYSAMTLGSFAVVLAISAPFIGEQHSDDISRLNSLSTRKPLLAALMALFMLSLAGIPPGFAGLLGKFFIFNAAVKAGFVGLAIIGVLNSTVSAYYYLRVVVAMYFLDNKNPIEEPAPVLSKSMAFVLIICAIAVMALGIFPSGVYDTAASMIDPIFRESKQMASFF